MSSASSHGRPIPPLTFQWDGEALVPTRPKLADEVFVIGQEYTLAEYVERSSPSHRHLFAAVREAWCTLPESFDGRWGNPDALRKHCLIKAGFFNERSIVCASAAEARRVGAIITPSDEYSIVLVQGNVVTEFTAKSMAADAMDRAEFQRAKEAVFAILADMLGVPVGNLPTSEAA